MRMDESFVANENLESYQYALVVNSASNLVGRSGTAGEMCLGVLQNKPQSGENATIVMMGRCRIKAGGTIAAGNEITATASGTAAAVASGQYILGLAITGVASGGNFTGLINHAGYKG